MLTEHYIPVKLTDEQRRFMEQSLGDSWLQFKMRDIELIIAGKATPLETIELIKMSFRVGYLKGMYAVIDMHNRVAGIGGDSDG